MRIIGQLVPPNNKGKEVSDVNLWIDYLELLCIYSYDGVMSKDDMIDEVRQIAEDYIDENSESEDNDIDESELDLEWETRAYNWLEYFQNRKLVYSNYYPFEVDADLISLKQRITYKRKIYVSLLLSSNLNNSKSKSTQKLTSSFEYISLQAFKESLPKNAKSFLFGKNPLNKGRKYSSKLPKKIEKLGKELGGLEVTFNEEDFHPKDSGDGGLDIFGYIPLDNRNKRNVPLFFGQCACSKNWKKKIHECDASTWKSNLNFSKSTEPSHMIFIPYSIRNIEGHWINHRDHRNAVIFDRERIISNLNDGKQIFFKKLPANEVVDNLIKHRVPF